MTFFWHDWAGYIGVLLVLLAFFLLQARKVHGNGIVYQLMNILGAIGVMLSLLFGVMNWPSFLMQLAWLAIGVFGIVNSARVRRELHDVERKLGS